MDVIEQNLLMIFGDEEAKEYRQARRRRRRTLTTTSVTCHASLQESDFFDLNRTNESTKSAAPSEAAGDTEGPAQWKEGPFVRVDVPSTRASPGLPMADDRGEPELNLSEELRLYVSDRYGHRGESLPTDVIHLLNKLNQSGKALDSQALGSTSANTNAQDQKAGSTSANANAQDQKAGSTSANANAQDQKAGTSKEKKPTSKQKDLKSPKKRKTLDPELLSRRNTVYEALSNYKKCRIDLNQYQVYRTANIRKERIRNKYEELKKDLNDYKNFAERKKIDVDEFILNLDKKINGTNGQDKQKIVEEESESAVNEPQVHIVKHGDKVYNIIINIPE